jgi:multimeric flavodoxin WrbA
MLVVVHSRTGSTRQLCDAAVATAADAVGEELPIRVLGAFDAGPDDVRWARAVLIATPARFGYMSGACKDFFERIYYPCLEHTRGLPYALLVKGDTDVDGALASVRRIATGLGWREVLPPVTVVGDITDADLAAASELGGGLAAGVATGVF